MGEAKRNLERVRQTFLADAEKWNFPASEWEAQVVAEIEATPFWTVRRYPPHILAQMGMPPRECHSNTRFMVENDPDGRCKQIVGWWNQGGNYVLHSVVERGDEVFCVTPTPFHAEPTFEFVPDPKIEWREQDDGLTAYRDGVEIGPGLRSDPAKQLAELNHLMDRLRSGMNPYKAVQEDRP